MSKALSLERESTPDAQTPVLPVSADPTISYCSNVACSFEQARAHTDQQEVLKFIWHTLVSNFYRKPDVKVLDLGCGTGLFTIPLAERYPWAQFIGADRSQAMLDVAKNKPGASKVRWEQQDALSLSYPNNSFEVVLMSNFLHHFQNPQDVIDQAVRVLKPNGVIISVYGAIEDIAEDPDHAYFPTALRIDCARTPALRHVERWYRECDLYGIASHKRSIKLASSAQERIERTKDRHVSVLHMICESEFQRGIKSLQNAIHTIDDTTWWCYQGVTITTAIKP
jgi:ubiquinone/menaquinone biosynthesis C-methylase UbiE